jgi:plastocyanin
MCILQSRSLLCALGAVAVSALALLPAAGQPMPRPNSPPASMPNNMLRPQINPNAAMMFSFNGFRSPSYGMMAYPSLYAAQAYGAGSMSYSSAMGGYGAGMRNSSYGEQGGMRGAGSSGYGGENGARSEPSSEEKSLSRILTASGVPNVGGQLLWPVVLRILRGGATDELRRQIDALFQLEAEQTQTGALNPQVAQELARSLEALRKFVRRDREERFSLPLALYEDAEGFLAKLDHAEKLLEPGLEPLGGKVRLEARQGNDEVSLADNRFEPPTLVVSAGTTVRWTNHGQHKHTVTSDTGDWGSKELGHEAFYVYTFAQPGTYPYHCEVHPAEMRGTIIVK